MALTVPLKWNGQTLDLNLPSASLSGAQLKQAIAALTNVPVERQKLMCPKAWKATLKDDAAVSLEAGTSITLMGTAETVARPTEAVKFVEDASKAEAAKFGDALPVGLVNEGNTCYANATLQCLRALPELRDATAGFARTGVPAALGGLFKQLDESTAAVRPSNFLRTLRVANPKFAETTQGPFGGFKQQDAEEFSSVMLQALASELKAPTPTLPSLLSIPGSEAGPNVVDSLMGLEMSEELTCGECPEEPVVRRVEGHRKLTCNISDKVNHLHEGLAIGLKGEVEKRSEVLGRNAVWTRTLKVTRVPKYLMVQLNRFFWKRTVNESGAVGGEACKILRVVSYPMTNFDVAPFCGEPLASELKTRREAALKAQDAAFRAKAAGGAAPAAAAPAAAAGGAMDEDGDADLAAAIRMSMADGGSAAAAGGAAGSSSSKAMFGPGVPADFTGLYDLVGMVTHKGRNSNSGHYIAFVRKPLGRGNPKGDAWLAFDDDSVEETTAELVASRFKGGGDDLMAYLLFFQAKGGAS